MPHTAYLGLGANIGDRESNIDEAVRLLNERVGEVSKRSSAFFSKAWGFESEHDFMNICVECLTHLSPRELLAETQRIERMLGRTAKSLDGAYHDRTIDIDILLYDDATIDEPDLKIPHPHMTERDFVMVPLREIMLQGFCSSAAKGLQ